MATDWKFAPTLECAIHLALEAHQGQVDKAGHPYILHPLRVMLALKDEGSDAMIVGVLHDVIEDKLGIDSKLYANHIEVMFGLSVTAAVHALTRHKEKESYEQYIERVKLNPLAVKVKIADLKDNLSRAESLPDDCRQTLVGRYTKALARLDPHLTAEIARRTVKQWGELYG